MTLSLPDEVRAALRDAGLSDDEVLLKTGDELRKAIGDRLTYELVVSLAGQRLAVAHWSGQAGKLPPDELIERNLDILKLRLIDRLSYAAIGREVGLTHSRVPQILRDYFGVDKKPRPAANDLTIPAASLPVVRDALRMELLSVVEDLRACLTTGVPDLSDELGRFDEVREVLRFHIGWEPREPEVDVELYVGRGRDAMLTDALRRQLDTERDMAANGSERAEASVAAIERLLAAMP